MQRKLLILHLLSLQILQSCQHIHRDIDVRQGDAFSNEPLLPEGLVQAQWRRSMLHRDAWPRLGRQLCTDHLPQLAASHGKSHLGRAHQRKKNVENKIENKIVVGGIPTPLKKWVRQLGLFFPIYLLWKNIKWIIIIVPDIPSGKQPHHHGESPFYSWVNPLFRLGHGFNSYFDITRG